MDVNYSFNVKSIATYAPVFLRYDNSVLVRVFNEQFCIYETHFKTLSKLQADFSTRHSIISKQRIHIKRKVESSTYDWTIARIYMTVWSLSAIHNGGEKLFEIAFNNFTSFFTLTNEGTLKDRTYLNG